MPDEAAEATLTNALELLSTARFSIGGEDQLAELRGRQSAAAGGEDEAKRLEGAWNNQLAKIQVRIGTLLKTDAVSFLLGAGVSKGCGGILIGSVPLEVERAILQDCAPGEDGEPVPNWLFCFYLSAARTADNPATIPTTREQIILRRTEVTDLQARALPANYEKVLSQLWRWRSALPQSGGKLGLDGSPAQEFKANDLDECLRRTARALAERCQLPTAELTGGMGTFDDFLRKILTRPLNLKRGNIFTLNYDTLVEQAADAAGVILIDGFIGTLRRVFRPECYDQDLYFPAQTTEGRVHRLERVAHLYKLHGSITWRRTPPDWDNPYGVTCAQEMVRDDETLLIYPTPAKFGDTLGMPYAELFRRFATCIVRPQTTLITLGYGFGDDHVNAIVRQALAVPSFTLVVVDPNPTSSFVDRLRERADRRVWISSGKTFGTFDGFVRHILPDLKDEDVKRRVVETYRALEDRGEPPAQRSQEHANGE